MCLYVCECVCAYNHQIISIPATLSTFSPSEIMSCTCRTHHFKSTKNISYILTVESCKCLPWHKARLESNKTTTHSLYCRSALLWLNEINFVEHNYHLVTRNLSNNEALCSLGLNAFRYVNNEQHQIYDLCSCSTHTLHTVHFVIHQIAQYIFQFTINTHTHTHNVKQDTQAILWF